MSASSTASGRSSNDRHASGAPPGARTARLVISLITEPPSQSERRFATLAITASLILFVALAPFANLPAVRVELFLPIYESVLAMCDLMTCLILLGQFGIARSAALLILAGGYLFSAAMALMHELSFPGLFTPSGLLWAGGQTTAWLYFFWHLGFPAAVIAFALRASREAATGPPPHARWSVAAALLGALGLAALMLVLSTAGAHFLPRLMNGDQDRPAKYAVAWVTWLATLAALPLLWRRARFSGLDLWLLVVIVAWSCEFAQAAVFNAGRFSFGWYTGRIYGLVACSLLLTVLILESGKLHRHLAESHAAEREQRQLAERRSRELNRLADSLEVRVRERTGELQRANETLQRTRDELRTAAALGIEAREKERTRVARELHDELGQALIMLKFQVADLEAYCLEMGTAVAQKTRAMRELIDQTIESARRVAQDLRPTVLDVLGLAAAAEWLVRTFRERHSAEVQLRIDPPEIAVGEPHATVVFRILQEALMNVARHAEASHVEAELTLREHWLRLRVADDGCGFDTAAPGHANGLGLLGMRERAAMVRGSLHVISAPGGGTTVNLSIPLGGPGGTSPGTFAA